METHWQTHKTRVRRYISKQVEDSAAVDDILQDVYLKAHTGRHTLKSEEGMGAWLYRIAHNAIMDHFRKHRSWDDLPDDLEAPVEDEAVLAYQELAKCLTPLMNMLPEKYRLPLQMAELEGMSQKQVAEQLGLSLTAAKSRIQRARVMLRERFNEQCHFEVSQGGIDFWPKDKDSSCGR